MSDVGITACIQCNPYLNRKKKGKVWVARDTKAPHYYKLYYSETPEDESGIFGGSHDKYYCGHWFEKIFNIQLEPGEFVEVEITLKVKN